MLTLLTSPAIHAEEHASTKKLVGNALALNLVRQLFNLGAIDAARAPGTKKPADVVSEQFFIPPLSPSLSFKLSGFKFRLPYLAPDEPFPLYVSVFHSNLLISLLSRSTILSSYSLSCSQDPPFPCSL